MMYKEIHRKVSSGSFFELDKEWKQENSTGG